MQNTSSQYDKCPLCRKKFKVPNDLKEQNKYIKMLEKINEDLYYENENLHDQNNDLHNQNKDLHYRNNSIILENENLRRNINLYIVKDSLHTLKQQKMLRQLRVLLYES